MNTATQELQGRVTLVSGASRGIGRAIALALGGRGATVVGTATSAAGAEGISAYLEEQGFPGAGLVLDVTDGAAIIAVVKTITERYGPPGILVNNAGITRDNLVMRMSDEQWQSVIDTNLTAMFRLTKACMRPMMKARQGRIINITSVVGIVGNAGQANYAAAKAGVIGFTRALAKELAPRNVCVNAVAPGFIDTDMTRKLSDEQKADLMTDIPLDRFGQPQDVANAVAYLASPAAGYVTGSTLHVNGGMHLNS